LGLLRIIYKPISTIPSLRWFLSKGRALCLSLEVGNNMIFPAGPGFKGMGSEAYLAPLFIT
jgi:hypothetical protein